MKKHRWFLCACGLTVAGCASGGTDSSSGGSPRPKADAGMNQGSGGMAGSLPTTDAAIRDDAVFLPPEEEEDVNFLAPRAGATYVYVANPSRNTVTSINSRTLTIDEQAPGDSPTYLATVPGQDVALVINAGSQTLGILKENQLVAYGIGIVAKANAIAIAPDGKHAVLWYDATQPLPGGAAAGPLTGSTQEVSVVDLTLATPKVTSLSVGFNPSAVVFSADSQAAFVVTDDGISKLRFAEITKDGIAPFTRLDTGITTIVRRDAGAPPRDSQPPPDALDPAEALDGGPSPLDAEEPPQGDPNALDASTPDTLELPDPEPEDTGPAPASNDPGLGKPVDVSVTSDGTYAVARREGSAQLLLVDLRTDQVTALNLSSPVTDLDLFSPAGTGAAGAAVFAVLRAESTLVRIEIPAGFTDETQRYTWPLQGGTIGSVSLSAKGKYAVLYSTAADADRMVVLDLTVAEPQPRTVSLKKPLRAVAVAPDESTALVLHVPPAPSGSGGAGGSGGTTGGTASVAKSHGYTVVRLADSFAKLQLTAADPNPFAITPNSSHAFVLLRDDKAGVRIAERVDLSSFVTKDFVLGSPPTSIAALSESIHKVFVGQVYPEGRISFIDWLSEDGSVQTVTGFALNGRIQQ